LSVVRIEVRNRADIAMEMVAVSAQWRTGYRFRPKIEALSGKDNGFTGPIPEPALWLRRATAPFALAPAADTSRSKILMDVMVHRRPPVFPLLTPPLICLEMRWRDHAVTKFSRQITVSPISTA